MKYLSVVFSLCAFVLTGCGSQAQHNEHDHEHGSENAAMQTMAKADKTETFKVYGNCSMCENRIETALANVKGIQSADWDVDSKMMKVNYESKVITMDDIQKKIAEVVHDTDKFSAKSEVYKELAGCCQYERAEN